MNPIGIVIPSLHPKKNLVELVKQLINYSGDNNLPVRIIVVDDGSGNEYLNVFDELKQMECEVLTHVENLGKGRALKTAFNYYLSIFPNCLGVVTADSDGQHLVEDIFNCVRTLQLNPNNLILGCREFDKKSIPFRSRFGNILTRNVFKILCGVRVSDTQTGLRGIPNHYMKKLLTVSGERFEYEMNMLIETKQEDVQITEVPIQTIYLDDNSLSHFNPITDSIKIYLVFLKFIVSSFGSFLIDITLFSLSIRLLGNQSRYTILVSTVLARIFSSFFNYKSNQKLVFKKSEKKSFIKYYLLVAIQMLVSAGIVIFLECITPINVTIAKVFTDGFLFLISFQIQRNWVYK